MKFVFQQHSPQNQKIYYSKVSTSGTILLYSAPDSFEQQILHMGE